MTDRLKEIRSAVKDNKILKQHMVHFLDYTCLVNITSFTISDCSPPPHRT